MRLVLTEPWPRHLVRGLESPRIAGKPGSDRTETEKRHVRGKLAGANRSQPPLLPAQWEGDVVHKIVRQKQKNPVTYTVVKTSANILSASNLRLIIQIRKRNIPRLTIGVGTASMPFRQRGQSILPHKFESTGQCRPPAASTRGSLASRSGMENVDSFDTKTKFCVGGKCHRWPIARDS